MPNSTYWIADPNGVKACVTDTAARDYWTHVQGWTETTEPVGQEFQWVRNEHHGGRGVLNHEAALLHVGLGWAPSDPPPVDGMPAAPAPETDGAAVKGANA